MLSSTRAIRENCSRVPERWARGRSGSSRQIEYETTVPLLWRDGCNSTSQRSGGRPEVTAGRLPLIGWVQGCGPVHHQRQEVRASSSTGSVRVVFFWNSPSWGAALRASPDYFALGAFELPPCDSENLSAELDVDLRVGFQVAVPVGVRRCAAVDAMMANRPSSRGKQPTGVTRSVPDLAPSGG
jgi:hypothetical protein